MNRKQREKNRLLAALLAALLMLSIAAPAVAETFSAIVTSDSMMVYGDAAMTARLGALGKNTVVRVDSYSGSSAHIIYQGRAGYAAVSDMKNVADVAKKAIVNTRTRVYQSASTSSASVVLPVGFELNIVATAGQCAMVEKNGVIGYMFKNTLTEVNEEASWTPIATATPAPTATPSTENAVSGTVVVARLPVYQYASTASTLLGNISYGQVVNVIGWNNSWGYIELNGRYGYCSIRGLMKTELFNQSATTPTSTAVTPVIVTTNLLPVYQSATTSSTKLGTMRQGQVMNLVYYDDSWACVELNGRIGFCAASGISEVGKTSTDVTIAPTATPSTENAVQGTVNVALLPVYATASTGSAKLGNLRRGQVVNVLKWNNTWAYIELQGHYGFCAVLGLTRVDTSATAQPTPTPSLENALKGTVNADSVPVYQLAGESSPLLGYIGRGTVVNVISVSGDWAYIELNGRFGFCKVLLLTRGDAPTSDAAPMEGMSMGGFTATVVYPGAKAYASTAANAASVNLALGQEVNVYAYSNEWACIVNGSRYAFVPIKYLSRLSYSPATEGSELQLVLKALLSYGYFDGVPSTSGSTAATTAIKRFQAACGLSQTGLADQTLQRILYSGYAPVDAILSTSMSNGATGTNVSRLQTRLHALGYLSKNTSIDGDYGSNTANAVSLFQTASGISATGKADAATLKALYSPTAASKPSSVKAADEVTAVSVTGNVSLSSSYVTTMPASLASNTSSYSGSMTAAEKLEYVIYCAQQQLGKPYVYGSTGPNSFDCSGLSTFAFKKIGISLKRSAYAQGYDSSYSKIEGVGNLRRGDLVFFNTVTDSDLSDHVGIYLGSGCFIHASSGGHKVVVSNLTSGYYNRVFSWGRRILG